MVRISPVRTISTVGGIRLWVPGAMAGPMPMLTWPVGPFGTKVPN